ncbi:MAG: ParB N-terminal domain-containing protein [Proteobacteria bacterium]|nr:ParB N-terminal domain-containing protein [Pseudomonadota bacterium]
MARSSGTLKRSQGQCCPAIAHLPIDALVPNPLSPRLHSRGKKKALARCIDEFRVLVPILVDKVNGVLSGHARLEAAKLLGLEEVPVIRLEHLSEEQAKAFIIADNRLAELATWDDRKLAIALKELSEIALSFDIELTGFEAPEIELRIQSLDPPEETDADDDVEVPKGEPVSRRGDLWRLGRNHILCASALETSSCEILLAEEKASAVFSDPPYNLVISGHVSGNGRKRHREFLMASGEMTFEEFCQFLKQVFELMAAHSTDDATFYACMDWRHVEQIAHAIRIAGFDLLNVCVWVKPNAGMGSLYRSRHELVFVFGRPGARRRNNVQLGKFGRTRTNVWNYPGMNSFARRGQVRGLDLHPTVKPLALVSDAILDVTARDEIVLDPFCGSGTTIIAAERTGRRGYGLELDPLYVDTAILRWQRMTKQVAVHASGKTFEEMRRERGGADATS